MSEKRWMTQTQRDSLWQGAIAAHEANPAWDRETCLMQAIEDATVRPGDAAEAGLAEMLNMRLAIAGGGRARALAEYLLDAQEEPK